jgi:hypothetical protein
LDYSYLIRKCYNSLFICIDFADSWAGVRFKGAWTQQNWGGTPIKNTPKANQAWATNPQYLLDLKKDMDLFISLGQPDGRLIEGQEYPFPDSIHHVMFSLWKLKEGEKVIDAFDRARKPTMSPIKEYRELS